MMESISSCFGRRKPSAETEPLLPQYEDDTVLQRQVHQKLHTYQQFRALSKGFMPSTEQVIINLRTLLASDAMNAENPDLSDSGQRLVNYSRQWIQHFTELLRHKNDRDQIQDLVWCLSKSRVNVDVGDLAARAKATKFQADTTAAYQSLKTVGGLMLANEDFRTFLADLNVVGREVFRDSAFKLSGVAEEAGKKLEPSQRDQNLVAQAGEDKKIGVPSNQDLGDEVADISGVIANGSAEVARTATDSAADKLSGAEGQTMLHRLKETVLKLRQRTDYSQSVSTLSLLIQRYALVYSRAAADVSNVAAEDTYQNAELDRAMHNAWALITSFGNRREWEKCEESYRQVMSHREKDANFEDLMIDVGNSLQKMLTDPSFFEGAQGKFDELRAKYQEVGKESGLRKDVDGLLVQLRSTFRSVLEDQDVHRLWKTTLRIFRVLSPTNRGTNPDLLQDSINVFIPLLIAAIQYIPVPRLEVSTPEIDLLLENLIIEPGHTINRTSFFPHRFRVETYNDLSIRKTHTLQTVTSTTSLVTIKLDGLSVRSDEIGFWLRAHSGIFRLADQGIASFALDERGIDIHLDVEIRRERLEQLLTLRAVRVHLHKLDYSLRQSRFSWLGFLIKPLLRPLLRRTLESQLAAAISDFFHAANRELLFARERLRATRIADPDDLLTFLRAIAARLTPEPDPDVATRVGVAPPKQGVFHGVYAPGSIARLWRDEAVRAGDRVEDFDAGGWRNDIFDTPVVSPS